MFVNAPIDRDAFLRAGAFEGDNPNPLYLVYREAARIAGVRRVVEKGDCPCIGLTEHPAGDGRTIVVAVNHEPREEECPVRIKGALVRVWRGTVADSRIVLSPTMQRSLKCRDMAECGEPSPLLGLSGP